MDLMDYCIICIKCREEELNIYDHHDFRALSDNHARQIAQRYAEGRRKEEPNKEWLPVRLDRVELWMEGEIESSETIPLYESEERRAA